jgi:hypothetical protein
MLLDYAIDYARKGLSVVPCHAVTESGKCTCKGKTCRSAGKHPRINWKEQGKLALTEQQLADYWKVWPDSNLGIVTGAVSRIAVLDIDGEEGKKSLEEIGLPLSAFPKTPLVLTGGGGYHLYFEYPYDMELATKAGVLPKVDIRANLGFIVAPPSLHLSGKTYQWADGLSILDLKPARFDWNLILEGEKRRYKRADTLPEDPGVDWWILALEGARSGSRNQTATRLVGRYSRKGLCYPEIKMLMDSWNARNEPPLPDEELERTIRSIMEAEFGADLENQKDKLQEIGDVLGVPVLSIRRVSGEEPKVILEFTKGVAVMTSSQLLNPTQFQSIICSAAKHVSRKLSSRTNPTHEGLAALILEAAYDIDAGTEATTIGQVDMLLKYWLQTEQVLEEGEIPEAGCFKREGHVWMSLDDIYNYATRRWGLRRLEKQHLSQLLRSNGLNWKEFRLADGRQRICWGVKPERVGL